MSDMLGSSGALSDIGDKLRLLLQSLNNLQQTLLSGINVNTSLLSFAVAGLPVSAPAGRMLYASNGRNPGEGAGAGTGCAVIATGAGVWRAIWSGLAVTA